MADLQTSVAVTDAALVTTDVTTNDASTTKHGFLKKLDDTATNFMNGAGNWAVPAGSAVSLSSAAHSLSANVTMTNADTYYDGPSVSLAAGTWLIMGVVTCRAPGGVGFISAKLWDGTTVESSAESYVSTANGDVAIPVAGIVAPGSTTTYKISAASNVAGQTILAATATNSAGNNASHIRAIKIA